MWLGGDKKAAAGKGGDAHPLFSSIPLIAIIIIVLMIIVVIAMIILVLYWIAMILSKKSGNILIASRDHLIIYYVDNMKMSSAI